MICDIILKRGLISDEEIPITLQQLWETGFIAKSSTSRISAMVNRAKSKYAAIEKVYNEYLKEDVDSSKTILIDDDLEQVAECAARGIKSILFALDLEDTFETDDLAAEYNISVARSWDDVREIVANAELGKTTEPKGLER